jgi:hypothetical protein
MINPISDNPTLSETSPAKGAYWREVYVSKQRKSY